MEGPPSQGSLNANRLSPPLSTTNAVCRSTVRHGSGIEHPKNTRCVEETVPFGQVDVKKSEGRGARKAEILAADDSQDAQQGMQQHHYLRRPNNRLKVIPHSSDDEEAEDIARLNTLSCGSRSQQHASVTLHDLTWEASADLMQPQQTCPEINHTANPVLLSPSPNSCPLTQLGSNRRRRSTELGDVHQKAQTECISSSQLHNCEADKHVDSKPQHKSSRQLGVKSALEHLGPMKTHDDGDLSIAEAGHVCESINQERSRGEKAPNVRYACPFYKHDEQKYRSERSCVGPGWPSIQRVKEHIIRKHTSAEFECSHCHTQFRTERQLNRHGQKPCQYRSKSPRCETIETIDHLQMQQLKSRRGKAKSEEEKWYEMYKILFPKVEKLPSPYFEAEWDGIAEVFKTEPCGEKSLTEELKKRLREKLDSHFSEVESAVLERIEDAVASALEDTLHNFKRTGCSSSQTDTCSISPLSLEPAIVSDETIFPDLLHSDADVSASLDCAGDFDWFLPSGYRDIAFDKLPYFDNMI